ncbi:MAG TPA: rhomboid family intramembrane serine protease [Paludibacter sp.]|nr:rhomboid family intramembrane serine protease [Paludibacter sp.]
MDIIEKIKQSFRQGTSLTKLIYINAGVFIALKLLIIGMQLFRTSWDFLPYLAMPADLVRLLHHPWTPLTYMFLHVEILHFLFNIMALYWFGKIFLLYFSEKQLVGLYLTGGLIAAAFHVLALNLFPYYSEMVSQSLLLGASGSIMAIIIASAMQSPNMGMQLLLLGNIKLKYIALAFVLISLFGITSNNGGGELAHLGGALAGYIFIVSLRQGKDITKGLNRLIDSTSTLFGPRKLKVKYNPHQKKNRMSDAEFNMNKARKMAEIDRILDKIKTSGYESLSAEEKKRLFDQGNNK